MTGGELRDTESWRARELAAYDILPMGKLRFARSRGRREEALPSAFSRGHVWPCIKGVFRDQRPFRHITCVVRGGASH